MLRLFKIIGIAKTRLRPEGGGGNYGPNSGGFDQLGFTTLTCTIDKTPIANGNYILHNSSSGKVLDNRGSTSDGTLVGQWDAQSNNNNQLWTVTYNGGGYYKLTCATSGKRLDDLGHMTDGSSIGQWRSGASCNQQWMIVPVGSYYKLVDRSSGKYLDTGGGGTTDGAVMQKWLSNPSYNQQWQFIAH